MYTPIALTFGTYKKKIWTVLFAVQSKCFNRKKWLLDFLLPYTVAANSSILYYIKYNIQIYNTIYTSFYLWGVIASTRPWSNLTPNIHCHHLPCTVCPGSSAQFYVVTYFIKWVTTSWTNSNMGLYFLDI